MKFVVLIPFGTWLFWFIVAPAIVLILIVATWWKWILAAVLIGACWGILRIALHDGTEEEYQQTKEEREREEARKWRQHERRESAPKYTIGGDGTDRYGNKL
jgi:fatty acid desaturase